MASGEQAIWAQQSLDGSLLGSAIIGVAVDKASRDSSKLIITGIPSGVGWQQLKDHFSQVGQVKFAGINQQTSAMAPGTLEGEVRYETAVELQAAVSALEGSEIKGHRISLRVDGNSKDGTKCIITGIPVGIGWQELKDHCSQVGRVAYCDIKPQGGADAGEAEVRYDDATHTTAALALDGSFLMGSKITVQIDPNREDKLKVFGVPETCAWQELKDHFAQIGQVAFVEVKRPGMPGGKGFDPMAAVAGMTSTPMGTTKGPMMGMKGCGVGMAGFGIAGFGAGASALVGEVRYDDPTLVQTAVETLDGSILAGSKIKVTIDGTSTDASKVIVSNIPFGLDWKTLKDHMGSIGQVAFANIKSSGAAGTAGAAGAAGASFSACGAQPLGNDPWSWMMKGMLLAKGQCGAGAFASMRGFGGARSVGGVGLGAAAGGCKGGAGGLSGEIRYDDPSHAQLAVEMLSGTLLGGSQITVRMDPSRPTRDKLWVTGIGEGVEWQELKDHFAQVGQVGFAIVTAGKGGRMASGTGFGMGCGRAPMMVPRPFGKGTN